MARTGMHENRTERIQARATKKAKEMLETAAAMQGVTLSEFVIASATERAADTIRAHSYVALSARDSRAFADALSSPREPDDALLAARDRYFAKVEP